jgi:hypothetical protein
MRGVGLTFTLPGAVRWLRRRVRAVQAALDAVKRLVQGRPIGTLVGHLARRINHDQNHLLLEHDRSLSPRILSDIPAPLGFQPSSRCASLPADHGMATNTAWD